MAEIEFQEVMFVFSVHSVGKVSIPLCTRMQLSSVVSVALDGESASSVLAWVTSDEIQLAPIASAQSHELFRPKVVLYMNTAQPRYGRSSRSSSREGGVPR